MKFLILTGLVTLLTACSTSSSIRNAGESESAFDDAAYKGIETIINSDIPDNDAYRIFHQAATGFVSMQSIRNSAEQRAIDFCAKKSKVVKTLRERTSKPPHILGNFPRIEIVFACIDGVEEGAAASNVNKYDQIKQLKMLLDDGALTNEEFESEKSKLLSK
ncbi:MAG: SHOCT domain-containing protein [Candidatus Thiodiazotropha sp. (ex Lucinoma borealis)]|nr:SHOCT domain-containing protein [Candidatus Thiodiazotropha sp. (ex Lucinoma borealis)]